MILANLAAIYECFAVERDFQLFLFFFSNRLQTVLLITVAIYGKKIVCLLSCVYSLNDV